MTIKDAIHILDLTPPFSKAVLKSAYRDALMVWHPDRFQGSAGLKAKAESKTYQINEAYALLSHIPESAYPYQASENTRQVEPPPSKPTSAKAAPSPTQTPETPQSRTSPSARSQQAAASDGLLSGVPATFFRRASACIVDYVIYFIAVFIVMFGFYFVDALISRSPGNPSTPGDGFIIFTGIFCAWLYHALLESSGKQATLGKMACGIVVTDSQGQRLSFGRASARFFGMIISWFVPFGFVMCAWTEKRQCLHDMMASCLVLNKVLQPAPAHGAAATPREPYTVRKKPDSLTVVAWVVAAVAGVLLIALIAHVRSSRKSLNQGSPDTANAQVNPNNIAPAPVSAAAPTPTPVPAHKLVIAPVQTPALAPNLTFEEIRMQADKGDKQAQFQLGLKYLKGDEVEYNAPEGVKWFRLAAEQGNAAAQANLGVCYKDGTGVAKDPVEAVKWFRLAVSNGFEVANYDLALCLFYGEGVARDPVEALALFLRLAKNGNADAQTTLGFCYQEGDGVAKDTVEAVKWFRLAAEQGSAQAQYNLAMSYINGTGVTQNPSEGVKWFRKAAEQGDVEAQFSLGFSYATGDGVAKDLEEAVKWYRLAAEEGFSDAQYFLGRAYAKGEGVTQDLDLAATWLRKAAEQGDDQAMNDVGEYHIIKKEPSEAVKWFRRGAESGNSSAQYNLGLSLANGEGIAADNVEAHVWWSLAGSQGHAQAKAGIKELEKLMSGVQIAAAQQKTSEFKPREHKFAKAPSDASAPSAAMPSTPPVELLEHLPTDQRLNSGALLIDTLQNQGGKGKLTLDNGLTEDAFVKMIRDGKLVASFYVRGGEKFTFDHVPDGIYRLMYCTGFGWDVGKRDFLRGRHAVRYDELLSYATTRRTEGASVVTSTDVLTLTLHKVANGNTKTTDITLEEFDRY